ncbi:MAG TPA: HAD family hydrolase [Verrucomicrobiae bacterium]|nr:HAD family hydrolase [Verrucomicrobiae bacterium]
MPCYQNSKFTVPLENVKAVLFDLFDTLILIDDNHECFTNSLLKLHSSLFKNGFLCDFSDFESSYVKVAEQIEAATATNLREPHFKIYVSLTLSNLGYRVSPEDKAINEGVRNFCREFSCYVQLDPQAVTVLEFLQEKYKTGLISNLSFSECAWDLLKTNNLKNLFDFIIISGDVNIRKPNPKIFKIALDSLGVPACEAIFIGDTLETDIEGAINTGMIPIHINRRKNKYIGNLTAKSFLTINKLEELMPYLNEVEPPIFC